MMDPELYDTAFNSQLSCRPFKVFSSGKRKAFTQNKTLQKVAQNKIFSLPSPKAAKVKSSASSSVLCTEHKACRESLVQMAPIKNKRYSHQTDKIKFTPAAVLSPQYHTICCLQVFTLPPNRFHKLIT